jgi:hypothetical protein
MDNSFIATNVRRIASKRRSASLLVLGGVCVGGCFVVGFLWLIEFLDPVSGGIFISGIELLFGGLLVWNMITLSRAIRKPIESDFVTSLKRYGPLQQTAEQIDREASAYRGRTGSFVTEHWLISARSDALSFTRLEDIVWIYKKVSSNQVTINFIPISTGNSYAAQIWMRSGEYVTIPSTEKGVEELLKAIAQKVPWVTLGYLPLTEEAWHIQRANFIATVDQRRKQFLFLSSDAVVDRHGDGPTQSSWDVGPTGQPSPGIISQSSPLTPNLNHPINDDLIESYRRRQDRKLRATGCFLLVMGLGAALIFILPIVVGMLEHAPEIFFSPEGVVITLVPLTMGTYLTAFGQKGREFFEKTVFKNWWTIILLFVVTGIGLIAFKYFWDWLLKSTGYGF